MRFSLRVFIFFFIFICFGVAAQDDTDPYSTHRSQTQYDESLATPWIERQVEVNAIPEDEDLIQLNMDTMPVNMTLYADLANLIVDDEDKVTRLWLVVKSTQGAYNGSYEGIRCATNEYKVYAYANPKRQQPLRKVHLPRWKAIKRNNYRKELIRDYLCNNTRARQKHAVIEYLDKSAADYEPSY